MHTACRVDQLPHMGRMSDAFCWAVVYNDGRGVKHICLCCFAISVRRQGPFIKYEVTYRERQTKQRMKEKKEKPRWE